LFQEALQEDTQEDKGDNSLKENIGTVSYSATEFAKLTGFNRNTLAYWLKKGNIPRSLDTHTAKSACDSPV